MSEQKTDDIWGFWLKIIIVAVMALTAEAIAFSIGIMNLPLKSIVLSIVIGAFCGIVCGYADSDENVTALQHDAIKMFFIGLIPFLQATVAGQSMGGEPWKHALGVFGGYGIMIIFFFACFFWISISNAPNVGAED